MDIVEAFGAARAAGSQLEYVERLESATSGDLVIIDAPSVSTTGPELLIDMTIRNAAR